jgi:hypothetical protein
MRHDEERREAEERREVVVDSCMVGYAQLGKPNKKMYGSQVIFWMPDPSARTPKRQPVIRYRSTQQHK